MKEYGSDEVEGALRAIHQNYYTQLCKLDGEKTKNIKIAAVGAGLDGRFDHISKLKVMKFKKAMNGLDNNTWKDEIKK